MTTSGTTGPPKRVLLGHESVIASVDSALNKIRSGGGEVPERRPPLIGTRARAPMPNLVPMPLALWSGIYNTLFASRVGAPRSSCCTRSTRGDFADGGEALRAAVPPCSRRR